MTPETSRRLLLFGPLAVVIAGGGGFYALLARMRTGDYDPHGIPSPLIGKPVPDFTLPPQPGKDGFSSDALRKLDGPVLVNFFASWCAPCQIEAPQLAGLQQAGVPIWGIAYKDKAAATAQFLDRLGDPYARLVRDEAGTTGIDFGATGVPETFFIDRTGIIRWHWAGPLTDAVIAGQLNVLLKTYS